MTAAEKAAQEYEEELQKRYAEIVDGAAALSELLDKELNPPKKWWQFWK